eukprot:1144879-Pelagomonas_calceolata.AAC.2
MRANCRDSASSVLRVSRSASSSFTRCLRRDLLLGGRDGVSFCPVKWAREEVASPDWGVPPSRADFMVVEEAGALKAAAAFCLRFAARVPPLGAAARPPQEGGAAALLAADPQCAVWGAAAGGVRVRGCGDQDAPPADRSPCLATPQGFRPGGCCPRVDTSKPRAGSSWKTAFTVLEGRGGGHQLECGRGWGVELEGVAAPGMGLDKAWLVGGTVFERPEGASREGQRFVPNCQSGL